MDRFDRIYALDNILRNARYPVSGRVIQEKLECSRATFSRVVEDMRDFLGAPIEYDRNLNGYIYAKTAEHPYELPGLWFNPSEIYALLACQRLLSEVQPGLLDAHIEPLKKRIENILEYEHLQKVGVGVRIRILKMAYRIPSNDIFRVVADATIQRKRLSITYLGRERSEISERSISPQRLLYYRDNWYLDAWCHLREALRSFSVDRMKVACVQKKKAKQISEPRLDSYFTESYGIFAGKPKHKAVLRFTKEVSSWVASEIWHPKQKGIFINGEYELEIPYSDSRELILDIMKYGPYAKVLEPKSLRKEVFGKLKSATDQYEEK